MNFRRIYAKFLFFEYVKCTKISTIVALIVETENKRVYLFQMKINGDFLSQSFLIEN